METSGMERRAIWIAVAIITVLFVVTAICGEEAIVNSVFWLFR